MQSSASYYLAQSHVEELHRSAAARTLRAEARRAGAEKVSPRRELVIRPSMFRRVVARLAV